MTVYSYCLHDCLVFQGSDCSYVNPLNAELNPNCHLLALVGAHYILHVSRIRVNYIYFGIVETVYHLVIYRVSPGGMCQTSGECSLR